MSSDSADDSGFCSSTATTVRRTRYHALGDVHCFTRRLLGASRRFAIVGQDVRVQLEGCLSGGGHYGGGLGRSKARGGWVLWDSGHHGRRGRDWLRVTGRGRDRLRVGELVAGFVVEGERGGNVGNVVALAIVAVMLVIALAVVAVLVIALAVGAVMLGIGGAPVATSVLAVFAAIAVVGFATFGTFDLAFAPVLLVLGTLRG